jgi:hypothetical protein
MRPSRPWYASLSRIDPEDSQTIPDDPGRKEVSMRRLRPSLSMLLIAALMTGCSYVPTRSLEYDPIPVHTSVRSDRILAVRVLREDRPERQYPGMFGRLFLTYIPLIPYVTIPYERLDESDEIHKRAKGRPWSDESAMTHLLMKAIARDLESTDFFSEIRLICDEPPGDDVDYVLEGSLESTAFNVYMTSYGLGIVGVVLWLVPLPIGQQEGNVEIALRLRDRSGKEVWTDRLVGEGSRIFTFYNSGGAPISSRYSLEIKRYGSNDEGIDGDSIWAYYASAMRTGMKDVKESLGAFIAYDSRHQPPSSDRSTGRPSDQNGGQNGG